MEYPKNHPSVWYVRATRPRPIYYIRNDQKTKRKVKIISKIYIIYLSYFSILLSSSGDIAWNAIDNIYACVILLLCRPREFLKRIRVKEGVGRHPFCTNLFKIWTNFGTKKILLYTMGSGLNYLYKIRKYFRILNP